MDDTDIAFAHRFGDFLKLGDLNEVGASPHGNKDFLHVLRVENASDKVR
jgi:hypothetical protein